MPLPVSISQQPVDQIVSSGQTATFSVAVPTPVLPPGGTVVTSYQWSTNNPRFLGASSNLYSLPFFISQGGYTEPGGAIPGATGASYTTPTLQVSDNETQLTCYVIQIVTIPQSVGVAPLSVQSFSSISSRVAVLSVIPRVSFTVSDNFQRANENPLSDGGKWTTTGGLTAMQVVSNACEGATISANCGALWTGNVWPNDQFAEVTIAAIGNSANIGPAVRGSISVQTFYLAVVTAIGSSLIAVEKFVNGSSTLLGAVVGIVSVNDVIRLEVQGTTLTCKQNGTVVVGPLTDSDIPSGSAGIYSTTSGQFATISNWDGGTL